jgi:hypothetical protein
LADAETHTGVFCDENFVRSCEDALHLTLKLLHLCVEKVKERRKICEMGAIVQLEHCLGDDRRWVSSPIF